MNIDEIIKQKEKLEETRKILEEKEKQGIHVIEKPKVYKIGKKLEIIDTAETRVQEKIEETCTHPILWIVNYAKSNRDYYPDKDKRNNYWYYCMNCGKLITSKIKPDTDYILTAPDDLNYVYYFRKQLLPEFQNEFFKIINTMTGEVNINEINEKLNESFSKQKIKKL